MAGINIEPDYTNANERAKTFDHVDKSTPIYKLREQLVANGHFATGRKNETRCYACETVFDKWKESDNVKLVHLRDINPNCRLVRRGHGNHQHDSCYGSARPKHNESLVNVGHSINGDKKSYQLTYPECNLKKNNLQENVQAIAIGSTIVDDIDDEIRCQRCRIEEEDLKMLPCGHRVCFNCYKDICLQPYPLRCPFSGCHEEILEYEPLPSD